MMKDFKQISERLKQIATYIDSNMRFADIGSDHAYLPSYVCLQNQTVQAIAGEISKGPYNRAKQTVEEYELTDRIQVRLGNGLEVIERDEVDAIVIAGMGGGLIASILKEGAHKLEHITRIIAQPNTNGYIVRKTLHELGYTPIKEQIIEENNHIYEMIVAERAEDHTLDEKEYMFGPILLQEKSSTFIKKWTKERDKVLYILNQMNKSTEKNVEKIYQYEKTLRWIEEVIR